MLAAHGLKIERAVSRTRSTQTGNPFATVRQALAEALRDEGAGRVVPQVVDHLARQIAEGSGESGSDIHN